MPAGLGGAVASDLGSQRRNGMGRFSRKALSRRKASNCALLDNVRGIDTSGASLKSSRSSISWHRKDLCLLKRRLESRRIAGGSLLKQALRLGRIRLPGSHRN